MNNLMNYKVSINNRMNNYFHYKIPYKKIIILNKYIKIKLNKMKNLLMNWNNY